jgi:hypothetical protein
LEALLPFHFLFSSRSQDPLVPPVFSSFPPFAYTLVRMAPTNYAKDEKVLCFHHDILYEAKILDVRHKDSSDKKSPFEYLVHYKGWKNT